MATIISGDTDIDDDWVRGPNITWYLTNNGAGNNNSVGRSASDIKTRCLWWFDETKIPAGVITGFRLKVWRFANPTVSQNGGTMSFHAIKDANTWPPEGTKVAGLAGTGEPCWQWKEYATVAWAGSAGLSTSGTDYDASAILSEAYSSYTSGPDVEVTFDLSSAAGLQFVEDIRDAVRTNNGIFQFTNESADNDIFRQWSVEAAAESDRPVFEVDVSVGAPIHYRKMFGMQ